MKPKEILEIEQRLGIELREVATQRGVIGRQNGNSFLLGVEGEVVGLNMTANKFKDISFLKGLKYLQTLELETNQIEDVSGLEGLINLRILNLSGNKIQNIPNLHGLTNLEWFVLDSNELWDISFLLGLTNLRGLNLRNNGICDISSLQALTALQTLNLSENQIEDISFLKALKALKRLDLSGNQIENIFFLKALTGLQELYLAENKIQKVSCLQDLMALETLYLGFNEIKNISLSRGLTALQTLDLGYNQIEDISFLRSLTALQTLYLGYNQIQDYSFLQALTALKSLGLGGNEIRDISFLQALMALERLNLGWNQIQDISSLTALTALKGLYLNNNQIQGISFSFLQKIPHLSILSLEGNPLPNIPWEIIRESNCLSALRAYLQDLELGKSPNNEVKLVLIGNGSVGKTQLARRLVWDRQGAFAWEEAHKSTHAIELHRKNLSCPFLAEGLDLNIWDFGGQDIYHATHHLFMQTRALFVLVWDVENEREGAWHEYGGIRYENFPLRYWLEYARYFGKQSPVLVVRNKTDVHGEQYAMPKHEKERLQAEFPNILGFVELSAKTGENFYGLEKEIQKAFEQHPSLRNELINKQLPAAWVRVRNKVRAQQQAAKLKQISEENFQVWCAAEQIPGSAPTLLDFFHQTGVLFYNRNYFSGQIILDQAWAIAAVYKVLDKDAKYFRYLRQNQGKLSYSDICDIWREYKDEERAMFLRFMLSCELCFETTENKASNPPLKDRTFVVPQLLPEKMNATVARRLSSLPLTDSRAFAFLPTSLIQRFIIKAHHLAQIGDIWQKGIWLRHGAAEVLVQAVYGRNPRLEIRHNEAAKQELVARVWVQFDLLEGKERVRQQKQDWVSEYWEGLEKLLPLPRQPYFSAMTHKKRLKNLIKSGDLEQAINELLEATTQNGQEDLHDAIIMQAGSYNKNEKDRRSQIIREENYLLTFNRIKSDLMDYIEDEYIEDGSFVWEEKVDTPPSPDESYPHNKPNHAANVSGSGNIVVQGVGNGIININLNKPEKEADDLQQEMLKKHGAIRILFMSAMPDDQFRFQNDFDAIRNKCRRSIEAGELDFLLPSWETDYEKLLSELKEQKPHVLHFSGHGTEQGICFVNTQTKKTQLIDKETLAEIFEHRQDYLQLVFLNACFSEVHAEIISQKGIYVLGINGVVENEVANGLSERFYVGFTVQEKPISITKAIKTGCKNFALNYPELKDLISLWKDGQRIDYKNLTS